MKIDKIIYRGVDRDGSTEDGEGMVEVKPFIWSCQKTMADSGYWITVGLGRDKKGVVEVIRVAFEDEGEMGEFFVKGVVEGKLGGKLMGKPRMERKPKKKKDK